VAKDVADQALELMRSTVVGRQAAIIGSVKGGTPGQVVLRTAIGGARIISPLHGEPLPRIC
ncbi:MAG: hydrogenase expression/formation protein HypE, partial [Thermodesulfobacteriota bacterium]